MIEIIRGAEVEPGIFQYSVPSLALCGKSRQLLLDACRQIKRAVGEGGNLGGYEAYAEMYVCDDVENKTQYNQIDGLICGGPRTTMMSTMSTL
jgi:hypothetical protein